MTGREGDAATSTGVLPHVITTGTAGQPRAQFDPATGWVRAELDGGVRFLSAAVAEEFAIGLEWAAKLARGEA